jgi:hypothetical protein
VFFFLVFGNTVATREDITSFVEPSHRSRWTQETSVVVNSVIMRTTKCLEWQLTDGILFARTHCIRENLSDWALVALWFTVTPVANLGCLEMATSGTVDVCFQLPMGDTFVLPFLTVKEWEFTQRCFTHGTKRSEAVIEIHMILGEWHRIYVHR